MLLWSNGKALIVGQHVSSTDAAAMIANGTAEEVAAIHLNRDFRYSGPDGVVDIDAGPEPARVPEDIPESLAHKRLSGKTDPADTHATPHAEVFRMPRMKIIKGHSASSPTGSTTGSTPASEPASSPTGSTPASQPAKK
jgi:hypothetical protein